MGSKLRVLIVDDSSICRVALKTQLEAEGDIEVVGEGEDAFSALELVQKLKPDFVTMDVQMPGKSGLEAVEQIMHRQPTPILVVTAESLSDEAGVAFRAIENGALDIVPKPSMTDEGAASELRALVRQLATVPVFQRFEGVRAPSTSPAASGEALELVVIGAGAGGMGSVLGLASRLPPRLRCPIILYQPVAPELTGSYSKYLASTSKHRVAVAAPPEHPLVAGEIVLVPGLRTTFMNKSILRVERRQPSLEALYRSVGEVYGVRAAGILLGGEGEDALTGLGALRDSGATTIIEMPRSGPTDAATSAVARGIAERACRLDEIAEYLLLVAGGV